MTQSPNKKRKVYNDDDIVMATLLLVFGFPILGLLNAVGNFTCLLLLGAVGFFLVKALIGKQEVI